MVREHWQHSSDADIDNNALFERNLWVQHVVLGFAAGLQAWLERPERQYSMIIMTHTEHCERLICTGLHAWQLFNSSR